MSLAIPTILLLVIWSTESAHLPVGNWDACGGRLERALDHLQKESSRRNRLDEEESDLTYHQELRSAPLQVTISRLAIKLPIDAKVRGGPWAKVERCVFEPGNSALETKVTFNDLSISGLVSLQPRDYPSPAASESCQMTLRLRRAGIEFYTSPVARGRGQMRIRTESSFLEPRFASIYAYGCHPTRLDKQIKRHDKWPVHHGPYEDEQAFVATSPLTNEYDVAEPREIVASSKEENIDIADESRQSRTLYNPDFHLSNWRKNSWITRPSNLRRKRAANNGTKVETKHFQVDRVSVNGTKVPHYEFNSTINLNNTRSKLNDQLRRLAARKILNATRRLLKNEKQPQRSLHVITPQDFVNAINKKTRDLKLEKSNATNDGKSVKASEAKRSSEPEKQGSRLYPQKAEAPQFVRETRDLIFNEDDLSEYDSHGRGWQSTEDVAQEMEDVFLKSAGQVLTNYIEKQLHPAIKETLMLSMGYTVSYG